MKICKFVILLTFVLLVVEKVYPIQACPTLTLKRRVNVDKVLRSAAHQYLYMADRLKGTDVFPKTYDVKEHKPENSSSNGGVVASIRVLCFICMKKLAMKSYIWRGYVC